MNRPSLTVSDDLKRFIDAVAERVTVIVQNSISRHGTAMLALTGGTTAPLVYRALASATMPWRERIAWPHVHVFWTDERQVPSSHPDSNSGSARAAFLDQVPIPPGHIHPIRGDLPVEQAAAAYELELSERLRATGRDQTTLDLALLSLGADGHIASIFPGSPLIDERSRLVAAVPPHGERVARVTLTPPALLRSRHILIMATGSHKAAAVAASIDGPLDRKSWPAHLLRSAGERVEWFVDRDAAPGLQRG